jgi:hypothetical protein
MKDIKSYLLRIMFLPAICLPVILLPTFGLSGCSSGGTEGGPSGARTVGAVKSVTGSEVTVGSASFDTSGSTMSGDEIIGVDEIQAGMIVAVDADESGHAEDIDYDAEVEGIVDSIGAGMMVVMGQNVDISQNPTFVNELNTDSDINNIPVGAMVEVSGYADGMGNILATYVKLEDHMADVDDDMELEGIITSLDMENGTFMIGGQIIYYDPTMIELVLEDGLNVEVDIMMQANGDLHAVEIEIEDDYGEGEEGHGVEIEGMVTSEPDVDGIFSINGQMVKLGDYVEYQEGLSQDSMVYGTILDVEGNLDADGVLIIKQVEAPYDALASTP